MVAEREALSDEESERLRDAVRAVMAAKGLRASPWAIKAGVASGSLYMFLKGKTNHLGTPLLAKLAEAAGVPVSMLTGEGPTPDTMAVTYQLRGDTLSKVTQRQRGVAPLPPGLDPAQIGVAISATEQQGAFQEGAVIYWSLRGDMRDAEKPGLCVCKVEGQAAMVLADVRRGFGRGHYILLTVTGRVMDGVALAEAHRVVWIKAAD